MAWEQLAIDKPHLAYLIIGGFTSLFMLCSLFVKEKLYIGEATVATLCGVIFGPHAADLFNPLSWGNTDKITLECSRIVLVVQCFAVGVELPKAYMERHWRSVTFLLVPVMTFGWLITSLFIWWMIVPLTWLEGLACAACVTATDPVLASSVVGKGKFAKRVPKHLRDVLSAESGCNDGMAFPFIYLSLYLIRYHLTAQEVTFHWMCFTILYECVFGAVYGFLIGYIGRHLIKGADRYQLIDRESFLVFYFVLALFCAGSGSLLGLDDLLVGFAAGVGFSNDGWFTKKTEESHVSNVIDLLLNLAYFVYLGSIIPWDQYNSPELGLTPWRLSVISIMVIFFRRIPIMLALKPIIPDVKNWREALFAGHFGPIGVGAIFAAILARAELETESTSPLANPDETPEENLLLVKLIWPVTTFLVISSILVHGSSIAVFTLGKRINTLSLTLSYTTANDQSWMNRLPRIASTSRTMSKGKADFDSSEEALPQSPSAVLSYPGGLLRRQREEDDPSRTGSRASSLRPSRKRKGESKLGAGGPISQSAITPQWRSESGLTGEKIGSDDEDNVDEATRPMQEENPRKELKKEDEKEKGDEDPTQKDIPKVEAYREGDHLVVEDEEGNVLDEENVHGETEGEIQKDIIEDRLKLAAETSGEHAKSSGEPHEKNEGKEIEDAVVDGLEHPSHPYKNLRKRLGDWHGWRRKSEAPHEPERRRGPAHAYQYGNTIIVEDEDGEVVKKYDIPASDRKKSRLEGFDEDRVRHGLRRVSTWVGFGRGHEHGQPDIETGQAESSQKTAHGGTQGDDDDDDRQIRFTLGGSSRRMDKADFIREIQSLDPHAQARAVEQSTVPEDLKGDVKRIAAQKSSNGKELSSGRPEIRSTTSYEDRPRGETGLTLVDSENQDIPVHSVPETLSKFSVGRPETAAARRRRRLTSGEADAGSSANDYAEDIGPKGEPSPELHPDAAGPSRSARGQKDEPETAAERRRRLAALGHGKNDEPETAAEKKRRLAALGQGNNDESSDSDEDGHERRPKKGHKPVAEPTLRTPGIRFADSPAISQGRVQWDDGVAAPPSRKK